MLLLRPQCYGLAWLGLACLASLVPLRRFGLHRNFNAEEGVYARPLLRGGSAPQQTRTLNIVPPSPPPPHRATHGSVLPAAVVSSEKHYNRFSFAEFCIPEAGARPILF